jgi:AbiV family abortive infection protein
MASGDLPDQTGQSIEACFANARDTLRAAKRVLEDENLPNISFHLTVLALEEIGKAALLGIWHIARSTGGESNSIEKRLDDHQFKLFWALWAPNLARGKVSKKEIEELRGLAKNLHEDRLDAMYVSIEPMEGGAPLQRLTQERAGALLKLAEARLGMELSRGWQPVDVNAHAEMRWFLEATADPEKRKLIFGQKAFEKLAELGQMRDWMIWLKDQFDKAEAEGCENLRRELARAAPGVDNPGQNKWQIVVRLFSPSHSIRNHAINSWNSRPSWIRLAPVGNNSHAVDVEFSYREVVPLQALGPLSYSAARIFVASLNIGSLGFWWWHLPNQSGRFHERLTDLNAPSGMRIDLNMHSGPEVEWKREALNDDVLCRIALCLGMISALEPLPYQSIIEPYLTGVALIAKSDLHLRQASGSERVFCKPCGILAIGMAATMECPPESLAFLDRGCRRLKMCRSCSTFCDSFAAGRRMVRE